MKAIHCAAFAAIVAAAAPAHANLVTNGSFETTAAFSGTKNYFAQSGVTGWSGGANLTFIGKPGSAADGTYLSVYGPFPATSPDGGNFVFGDGDPSYSGAIFQTLTGLTTGQSYTVSFYQAAGQQQGFNGPTTEQWRVSFGSSTQNSALYSLASHGVGQWQAQSLTFVAGATSQVLSFLAAGTPGGAPPISFLDGVSVVATPAQTTAVPEPATLAVLGTGLIGLFAVRRRRSKRG